MCVLLLSTPDLVPSISHLPSYRDKVFYFPHPLLPHLPPPFHTAGVLTVRCRQMTGTLSVRFKASRAGSGQRGGCWAPSTTTISFHSSFFTIQRVDRDKSSLKKKLISGSTGWLASVSLHFWRFQTIDCLYHFISDLFSLLSAASIHQTIMWSTMCYTLSISILSVTTYL